MKDIPELEKTEPEQIPAVATFDVAVEDGRSFYRMHYGVEGDIKEVGFGNTDVVVDGAPSFHQFYLWPWAHRLLYTQGAQAYYIFPWRPSYTKVSPWTTIALPLIFAPEDFGDDALKLDWVNARRRDLGLLPPEGSDAVDD